MPWPDDATREYFGCYHRAGNEEQKKYGCPFIPEGNGDDYRYTSGRVENGLLSVVISELREEFNVTGGLKEHDRKIVMELKSRLPADLHKRVIKFIS